MDLISECTFIKSDGSKIKASEALNGKSVICLYFSGHWCPPCRAFTPTLKGFYEGASSEGIEIIFISSDKSVADQMAYMKESHGDWPAIEHGDPAAAALKKKYEISGVPALVVIKTADGSLITKEGRADIKSKGLKCIEEWKSV